MLSLFSVPLCLIKPVKTTQITPRFPTSRQRSKSRKEPGWCRATRIPWRKDMSRSRHVSNRASNSKKLSRATMLNLWQVVKKSTRMKLGKYKKVESFSSSARCQISAKETKLRLRGVRKNWKCTSSTKDSDLMWARPSKDKGLIECFKRKLMINKTVIRKPMRATMMKLIWQVQPLTCFSLSKNPLLNRLMNHNREPKSSQRPPRKRKNKHHALKTLCQSLTRLCSTVMRSLCSRYA